jgi:hypothetical protein
MTQNVGFGLRQIRRVALNEESDPMRGAVDAEDELEAHHTQDAMARAPSLA